MSQQLKSKRNGDAFEDLIKWQNQRYKAQGIAVITKQATEFIPIRDHTGKMIRAKVEEKATVDFIGRYKRYPIAIEAKHTNENRISLNAVEDHQAEFMDEWIGDGSGGIGYVLVSFGMCEFYFIPWSIWRQCRNSWNKKKGSKADPQLIKTEKYEFKYSGMASFHKDELPGVLKVKCNGQNGLPYLDNLTNF